MDDDELEPGTDQSERRAAPQHPSRPERHRGRLRELREHHVLALRVHTHLRADRARGRRGGRPRCGRRARQRVAAVRRGADRGAAGLVVEVPDDRGDPESAGDAPDAAPDACASPSSPTSTGTSRRSRQCSPRIDRDRARRALVSRRPRRLRRRGRTSAARIVRERSTTCLGGNHDLAVRGTIDLERFQRRCRHRGRVDARRARAGVARVPRDARRRGRLRDDIALYHGSARDPVWEYVLSEEAAARDARADRRADRARRSQPRRARVSRRRSPAVSRAAATESTSPAARWLLNPGSVGQPRDGDPRAAYLRLDLERQGRRRFSASSTTSSARSGDPRRPDCPSRFAAGWRRHERRRNRSPPRRSSPGAGRRSSTAPRQPTIPHALAQSLRAQADGVAAALAAGDGCTAQQRAVTLRTAVITAVNERRLPARFQETLVGAVNDLASRITCVPPPARPAPPPAHGHEHKKHGEHGEHGKHGKKDD